MTRKSVSQRGKLLAFFSWMQNVGLQEVKDRVALCVHVVGGQILNSVLLLTWEVAILTSGFAGIDAQRGTDH